MTYRVLIKVDNQKAELVAQAYTEGDILRVAAQVFTKAKKTGDLRALFSDK